VKPARQPIFGTANEPNSLFGEILDWMLAPLLFLWPISIAVTHNVANNIANQPYDQALAETVSAIARLVTLENGRVVVNFPAPARALLRADESDATYYQVRNPGGEIVTGDRDIPAVAPATRDDDGSVRFRDAEVEGESIRIAYAFVDLKNASGPALVQVAETRKKRENLASRIISGVLLPQFAIVPLAVLLVYRGLTRGLAPLSRLQKRLRRRRPGDLSPIDTHGVPDELRPVVVAFNEMMARLELNLEAQQRFIADAAHQMRTPLTGLKTQTELALSETEPEQVRQSLQRIAVGTDRAAHLINQLLLLARAEASHDKVHAVEPVDLDALARDASRDWVARAMDKRIDLGYEHEGAVPWIDGTPLLLREMINNLVDNALKYTPAGGRVTVRVRGGAEAILEVEDTGTGIDAEERKLVFERFYRVLGTGADGSGLGLPIVREIAELHRGSVRLEANPQGQGTVAVVTLPLRTNGAATALAANS
jgi:two-component system sensor histidine kinase TctE